MNELKVLKTTIEIGLEKPVKFLHITDTHLAFEDNWISNRWKCFEPADNRGRIETNFLKALDYAKEHHLFVVHTGDLLDFFSDDNFNFIDEHFNDIDYIYAAGNHDFFQWRVKATEDHAYKWEMIKLAAPHFKPNLYFDSRIINGVNFVTMDDSYYLLTDGQVDALKAEAAKGYPIILCMHVPLYAPKLAIAARPDWDPTVSYVLGAPEELLATYPNYRRLQQTPDEATKRAIAYIKSEPLIKAIIAGHNHINHEEILDNGVVQINTHGSFEGYVREITLL